MSSESRARKSILLVDDDRGMVDTLIDILEANRYQVWAAHSGDAAVTMTRERPYDAVLMDIQMPGLNGVEALRAIKAEAPETQVIMMTAYTRDDLAREAERTSGRPVLGKPLDVEFFLGLVAGIARQPNGGSHNA